MTGELDWFKSSYSDSSEIDSCVEVAWRKSSYSDSSDINDCVEVAAGPGAVHVRDSKSIGTGPQLAVSGTAWAGFVAYASGGV
ncbi:DUF397 domain-containing protein [Streptomyces sp. APSN-46.1]|uniref:DUF397 domain-containing protein n=1 Tax=Streptomyces sp. APSN-46.1 TaxID=2929049 RepID=UPI001FB1C023|nr:DUF397 domain-containing protein [Streptomyces sp. APSN-46.1]MCJ1678818.1 DUF397 domain-containing protein [Streptomyces sp. APSN-46.1]